MAEPLSSLASPSLPYWRCCDALPKGVGCELRAAEGGGWRTRGRSGSSAASVVPLAETLSAEGSGLPRHIDLRVADATTPRRTVRASTRRPTPQRHTADFHLTQKGNRHFTLCFQGCGDFHASENGEPPRTSNSATTSRRRMDTLENYRVGCLAGTRTPTDRIRICSATITPRGNRHFSGLAGSTGLEPATPGSTVQCANQLRHNPVAPKSDA